MIDLRELAERVGQGREVYFDPEDIVAPDLRAGPWKKCCSVCALLPHDPQHLGAETLAMLRTDILDDEIEFYCVHRLSRRGLHRVCASAAAIRLGALAITREQSNHD